MSFENLRVGDFVVVKTQYFGDCFYRVSHVYAKSVRLENGNSYDISNGKPRGKAATCHASSYLKRVATEKESVRWSKFRDNKFRKDERYRILKKIENASFETLQRIEAVYDESRRK